MSDNDHAVLAPSSASRIVKCTGSRKLASLYPQDATIDTQEGEASHWAAAMMLQGATIAANMPAPNGVKLNDEMIECAQMYVDHIRSRQLGDNPSYVEQLVKNDALHPSDNYGTPDHNVRAPMHLYVDDYKYGHKYIDVFENWQLMNYVALILHDMGVDGQADQSMRVTMTIVQPRCYHRDGPIRTWSVMASELRPYFNIMRNKFDEAMRDDAPCTVNDECEFCPGKYGCEALIASSSNARAHAYSSSPIAMTPAATGLELKLLRRAREHIEARISGLEEQAESMLRRGINVPWFQMGHGEGAVIWTVPDATIIDLAKMSLVDISKTKALTPIQSKKLLPAEFVAAFSRSIPGKAKLVEDDGRKASRVFGK